MLDKAKKEEGEEARAKDHAVSVYTGTARNCADGWTRNHQTVNYRSLKELSEAVQRIANNLQRAKVAQALLSAGNYKLNASTKQLADIR